MFNLAHTKENGPDALGDLICITRLKGGGDYDEISEATCLPANFSLISD